MVIVPLSAIALGTMAAAALSTVVSALLALDLLPLSRESEPQPLRARAPMTRTAEKILVERMWVPPEILMLWGDGPPWAEDGRGGHSPTCLISRAWPEGTGTGS